MNRIWFKRKRYGFGWYPATWEGWVVMSVYVGIALFLAVSIPEDASFRKVAVTFILPLAILTLALVRICYRAGEPPRWQWNENRPEDDSEDPTKHP